MCADGLPASVVFCQSLFKVLSEYDFCRNGDGISTYKNHGISCLPEKVDTSICTKYDLHKFSNFVRLLYTCLVEYDNGLKLERQIFTH